MPSGHPNLSPKINALLEKSKDPRSNIDLSRVCAGSILEISLGEGDRAYFLKIRIVKPAGAGFGEDAAEGVLIKGTKIGGTTKEHLKAMKLSPIGKKCYLVGSCTKNSGAPLGFSMLQLHNLSMGRHLLWYILFKKEGEYQVLSPKPIIALRSSSRLS